VLDELLQRPPYGIPAAEKSILLEQGLAELRRHHEEHCPGYRDYAAWWDAVYGPGVPFLPVRLFKTERLQSIPDDEVYRVLTSSGTGGDVSRVPLDRATARLQSKVLTHLMTDFLGRERRPMVIVDAAPQSGQALSARTAASVGLAGFGRDHFYLLDDRDGLPAWLEKHAGQPVLVSGFTSSVWEHLAHGPRLEGAIVVHGGGWKKLADRAVAPDIFKQTLLDRGVSRVHNYYGMAEQVGSIFVECEHGCLHAPSYADVLIRDPLDPRRTTEGWGAVQLVSLLPRSCPGHSLLSEDEGRILGVDDCPCGRLGTRFEIRGRLPRAEVRGCSNVGEEAGGAVEELFPTLQSGRPQLPSKTSSPFGGEALAFLERLSQVLSGDAAGELAALGFWLRPAHLRKVIDDYRATLPATQRVKPRGRVLHIAPGNVDSLFVYTWALSLLCGNANLVRVSGQRGPSTERLLHIMRDLAAEFPQLAAANRMVSYPADDELTAELSAHADLRVLWGSDRTLAHLRSLPLSPTALDLAFGDKVSACVIVAESYLELPDDKAARLAWAFYADTYPFDQQGCSSPLEVLFVGSRGEEAAALFWERLTAELARRGHRDAGPLVMDKLVLAAQRAWRQPPATVACGPGPDRPTVIRRAPNEPPLRGVGGMFGEVLLERPEDLHLPPNCQTLTHFGLAAEQKEALIDRVDRLVPIGQALVFAPVWDGHVLFDYLLRRVQVS